MVRVILRSVITHLVLLYIFFFTTGFIIKGIHYVVFRSSDYIVFYAPLVYLAKFFVAFIIVLLFIKRHAELTRAGEIFIPVALIISLIMILLSTLWFQAADEERIVVHRAGWHQVKEWNEVEHVATSIEKKEIRNRRTRKVKVIPKYQLCFTDNSCVNVWSKVDKVYDLHQVVEEKGIPIEYQTIMKKEKFETRYSSYFRRHMNEATEIFGIDG